MADWIQDDRSYVWHPFTQMQTERPPLPIVRAKDSTLYAADGSRYLDCNSSWWVCTHGHGNPHLKQALIDQFDRIDHVIFAGVTHPSAANLSREVVKLMPEKLTKVFFSDDGSTAVEVALKMAFQFWYNQERPRQRVLALEGAYHGDTFGAMSIGQRGYFNEPFEHLFFDVDFIPFPTEDEEESILQQASDLLRTGEFAALIVEPLVQGSAGMRMYSPAFLDRLAATARQHDVLVIFDEIMTGWGRTGRLFAMDYCSVKPDIVCLSKGLTAGVLPLGLTVATEAIFNAFLAPEKTKALLHGHSYTGNALACAVACANIELIHRPEFGESIARISAQHAAFKRRIDDHSRVASVRQLGTILAFDIVQDSTSSYFSSLRDVAYDFFLERGLLVRPLGNVIFLNPPYCTTNEELVEMYEGFVAFLDYLSGATSANLSSEERHRL